MVTKLLNDFEDYYNGFYDWLAGQYEKETGGFFYARSSKTIKGFHADIESTAQAMNILDMSNLSHTMPDSMKQNIITFFQSRQEPSGYFYDTQTTMKQSDRMVSRAIMYSYKRLRSLGAKPVYPLPGKENDTAPKYLETPETYLEWLKSRDWSYSWMAGDAVQTSGTYLASFTPEKRKPYMETVWSFLENLQDKTTGTFGDGTPLIKVSGLMKLSLFYREANQPMPNVKKIYATTLDAIRNDFPTDMCWVRNPLDLLTYLKEDLEAELNKDLPEIITISQKNLKMFLRPDGGYSRHFDRSLEAPNEAILGAGLVEGDMNAGTQALKISLMCHELAKVPYVPYTKYTKGFYKALENND